MFVRTHFMSLTHDKGGAPVAVLHETNGNRELKVAVSANDASRIAILNFGLVQSAASDLAIDLISALGAEVTELRIIPHKQKIILCDLFVKNGGKMVQVSARPGEAIIMAIKNECPILVDETLFQTDRKVQSLKERLRGQETTDFGSTHIL